MPSIKSKEGSSSYQTFDENDFKFDKHHLNRFIDDNITPSIGSVLDTSLIDKDKGFLSFLGSDVSKISFRMNILKRDFTMLDYYNSEELEPYLNMETYIKHLYSIISEVLILI